MNSIQPKSILRTSAALIFGLSAAPASAQYYKYPSFEAECPNTATGAYATRLTSPTGFSGSGYIRSVGNISVNQFNNTSADRATYSFLLRDPGYYALWMRVNTNGSANDDSWFYRVDNLPWAMENNLSAVSGWRWVRATADLYLEPGLLHTLEIANRENGLDIDKIVLLSSALPAPTGTGQPAYNCPVPMYFETECRTGAFGAYQQDKKAKTGFAGTGYIESATQTLDPNTRVDEGTYYFEAGAGTYNFYFRIHNNSNASNDSWFYRIDNGGWVQMNNTSGLGSGWRWAPGTSGATLTRGTHTLQVRNREAGLSMDRIAFIPSGSPAPSGTSVGSAAVNCEPFTTMADWDFTAMREYMDIHLEYIISLGPHALDHHVEWHALNGPGGTRGLGSGIAFLGFHRAMQNEIKKFAMERNARVPLPIATVGGVFGDWPLYDSLDALDALGRLDFYDPRWVFEPYDWGIPQYLTLGGIPSPNPEWDPFFNFDGPLMSKLEDIPDLDMLGLAIGYEYHISLHLYVNGTFGGGYSPTDPLFYGWHGLIDKIVTQWLGTPAGQAWVAANPYHPFLNDGFTGMHGWNNEDWAP
jgi:hypothetical protein